MRRFEKNFSEKIISGNLFCPETVYNIGYRKK